MCIFYYHLNKVKYVAENNDSGNDFGSLKILSYNVWFREDLELHKRMKAIGDLVQLHSPDFICFQVPLSLLILLIPSFHVFNFNSFVCNLKFYIT